MESRRWMAAAAGGVAIAMTIAGCGGGSDDASGSSGSGGGKVQLSLVAYSTPQAAYEKIISAYQKTPQGKNVSFSKSFGASGDQSRAVEAGLPADIVAFSLEPDMTRLVKKGTVAATWNADANKGMITDSVVALATRKGNPKGIKTWEDLVKPGTEVITPNPFTSGGARWNVMAAYGSQTETGKSEAEAVTYLNQLFKNVPVQDDSARKALQTFTSGKGDVMIAYENEAIFAQQNKQPIDYVVPDDTMLIENPAAVTTTSKHPAEAKAFLDYLHGDEAQKIFADNGYRPISKTAVTSDAFPTPKNLYTIADFGGWTTVTKKFFDPESSVMATVEKSLGVSTEKK